MWAFDASGEEPPTHHKQESPKRAVAVVPSCTSNGLIRQERRRIIDAIKERR
jgi:hypothetical protein